MQQRQPTAGDGSPDSSLTRRQALVGATRVLVGVALGATGARVLAASAAPTVSADAIGKTSLHQEVEFGAPPPRVYAALLDARQFATFSGGPADVAPEAGRAFSLFGKRITGRNVELTPGARIVQAWRSAGWPAGIFSIVRFTLNPHAGGTTLVLDHTGFPEGAGDALAAGWYEHYWQPLKKYLG